MPVTLSTKLLHTLQKGKARLGAEALRRIARFVESQRTAEHAFRNKSGKADLYYTAFGWTLSRLLGIGIDPQKMHRYLSQQQPEQLDLVHYAAYIRCRMLRQWIKNGKAGLFVQSLLPFKIRALDTFTAVPHADLHAPYTQFLWHSLREDAGRRTPNTPDTLADYHVPGGGYRNTRDGLTATTNATVAALALRGPSAGYRANEDLHYLRNLQDTSGGFRAAPAAPFPDLLSTATALFVLDCYHTPSNYPAQHFIESHWLDSGGFSATLPEDHSDVEYTFYGLLALGASAQEFRKKQLGR
ncbi:MAG: hypothetical protein LBR65_05210 [Culturomica sp.]|jgi:hypothetical protein|nr:hypothetical protein [Culturomica sp.]